MAIPQSQLVSWANQGAVITAQATHKSIRNALENNQSPIKERILKNEVEVYLQGSYKNNTNIRGDSDVDLVVELNTTFGHNAHSLPLEQKQLHDSAYSNATYGWEEFREDVITALENYFRDTMIDTTGNKSIKLKSAPGRLKTDIVPAIRFREYSFFFGTNNFKADRGIKFYHKATKRAIINFPHHHFENGRDKNSKGRTNGWFKPIVRVFKNARSYLIDNNSLSKNTAPSYFLQSLLYNVPDSRFGTSYQNTVFNILEYLYNNSMSNFRCQNKLDLLFGSTPEQWNESDAGLTIQKLVELWDNWT